MKGTQPKILNLLICVSNYTASLLVYCDHNLTIERGGEREEICSDHIPFVSPSCN